MNISDQPEAAIKQIGGNGSSVQSGNHFIIAIGASAGGLESIHEFFDHMQEGSNSSFIIIQHLSPDYKSLLVELVSRHTNMKVYEAEHGFEVAPNCIYVIPNNKLITIRKNKLLLAEKNLGKAPNNAIDVFLYSLASEKQNRAIAIILSGTGTDGTKGIEVVKKAGGLVIVQNPTTAKFDGMPNSAINSGNVDFVLPPALMPAEILSYIRDPLSFSGEKINDKHLRKILALIQKEVGYDFNYYKTPTIIRRINRRMARGDFQNVEEYLSYLKKEPTECRELGKDFLIGVTRFFRDDEAFDLLANKVIPDIIDQKQDGDTFKVWISACSTGEEAYSVAILINEALEARGKNTIDVKIFATDLDDASIEHASQGIYPQTIQNDVSHFLLEKYFNRKGKSYHVIPRIRKQMVFARHNIIKDPPLIKNDLVSCRNMLIYMSNILQQRIFSTLLFSTVKNGYLFFGSSENPSSIRPNIAEISDKWKIFKKISDTKVSNHQFSDVTDKGKKSIDLRNHAREGAKKANSLADDFYNILADDFNFVAFYIDRDFEIKEALGNYEKLLTLPRRQLKLNLLRMLPTHVSTILHLEIKKAWQSKQKVIVRNIQFQNENTAQLFQVLIKPDNLAVGSSYTTIVISENASEGVANTITANTINLGNLANEYIFAMEAELSETKNNLQVAVEDLETANEELQSSNEELLSANEELQSSNEELQSLNEELHTLNTEHQAKIRELTELNDDLVNYFRSTDIGQVFLDRELNIRKFNPASARMINFIETDIGRPIAHISTNIRYENFLNDIESVLTTHKNIEKEVLLLNGRNVFIRILPYLTLDKENAGVVISFVDITPITQLNNIVRGVFNSSPCAILAFRSVFDDQHNIIDFRVEAGNWAAGTLLNTDGDLKGKLLKKELPLLTQNSLFEQYVLVAIGDKKLHAEFCDLKESKWYEVNAVKMMDGFVATYVDVTDKRTSEQRLKKNYVELMTVKEHLKVLNAELELKVEERTKELSVSEERLRLAAKATNDALWDWDFASDKIWWGDAFFNVFGYKVDNGFDRRAWIENVHPDDREMVQASLHKALHDQRNQWQKEYRFRKKNGIYANVFDRGYITHNDDGSPRRMIGSMMDLTELKQAEEEVVKNIAQRKFIAESMPLIVWIMEADGTVKFVNKQFEVYTGISQEDVLKRGWQKAFHPDDLPTFNSLWQEALEHGSDFQFELRMKLYNNNFHWNILRARAMKSKGNVVDWVVTTIDIHDQKTMNEVLEQKVIQRTTELQLINEALEASNRDLQQFASIASHDLQEPVRKMFMFSRLIRDKFTDKLPPDVDKYLEKIMQSSNRMKLLINNVLNFSKVSINSDVYKLTSLKNIILDLLDDYEILINDKRATIDVGELPNLELIPGQIRQVFQNLLSNALKFSKPTASPHIEIRAEKVSEKSFKAKPSKTGDFCKITFSDNGIGFDEAFKDNIFALFQRLHSKDKYEGTGIGLAIVKKIIEKHNGIITAFSKEGQGATFEIVLPVSQTKTYNTIP